MKRYLVKMADRNEEIIPKVDCWMRRWIWWIILPMALWLVIGAIIGCGFREPDIEQTVTVSSYLNNTCRVETCIWIKRGLNPFYIGHGHLEYYDNSYSVPCQAVPSVKKSQYLMAETVLLKIKASMNHIHKCEYAD